MLAKAAVAFAVVLPAIYAAAVMVRDWVPLPFWDEWSVPGEQIAAWLRGTLSPADLLRQHNEHRRVFPSLLNVSLVAVTGQWDTRQVMALTFALVCACAGAFYLLLRRTISQPLVRVLAIAAMTLALFSPRQYENFAYGSLLGEVFVPSFALAAAALVNLSAAAFRTKALINAVLAGVSTYTFGGGMLLWLFAFPLQLGAGNEMRSSSWRWRAAYVAAGAVAIGLYFVGYEHPAHVPRPASAFTQAGEIMTFFLIWIGNPFLTGLPFTIGVGIFACFLALSGATAALVFRGGDLRPHYPWLALGWLIVISGIIAARARVGFGFSAAYHVRYVTSTVFLYVSVGGLLASVYSQIAVQRTLARALKLASAALAIGGAVLWVWTFVQEQPILRAAAGHREHLMHVLRWSLAIPHNPDIALFSPYPSTPETIRTLAERDAIRPRLVSHALTKAVQNSPPESAATAGALERVAFDPATRQLDYAGWTATRGEGRTGDYVVIGFTTADGTWTPLGVTHPATDREANPPGATEAAKARFARSLYRVALPPGPLIFRAWAANARTDRVTPLAGAVEITAQQNPTP